MRAGLVVALLATAVPLSGCGGGGTKTAAPTPTVAATAPADPVAAAAEVKTSWAAFFDGSKPAAQRVPLLQDGEQLGQALALGAKDPNASKLTAEATAVTFTSPTQASVVYKLLAAGTVLLPNATGTAVYDGGRWKVSKQTFCQLIQLGQGSTPVPGCS
jgi:hypothetical protein